MIPVYELHRCGTLKNPHCSITMSGEHMSILQPLTGNGDVYIVAKNSRVGRIKPQRNKQKIQGKVDGIAVQTTYSEPFRTKTFCAFAFSANSFPSMLSGNLIHKKKPPCKIFAKNKVSGNVVLLVCWYRQFYV